MDVLYSILKIAVVLVLTSSLLEALVLSLRHGWRSYDWRASGISVVDFLVREYPLRWLLPLAFWTDAMDWFWQHRLWTLPMHHWSGWVACFVGQEFCYYWYHRAAHRVRWFWCTHAIHHSPHQLNLSAAYRFGWLQQQPQRLRARHRWRRPLLVRARRQHRGRQALLRAEQVPGAGNRGIHHRAVHLAHRQPPPNRVSIRWIALICTASRE